MLNFQEYLAQYNLSFSDFDGQQEELAPLIEDYANYKIDQKMASLNAAISDINHKFKQ